jgi:hypothetical protein
MLSKTSKPQAPSSSFPTTQCPHTPSFSVRQVWKVKETTNKQIGLKEKRKKKLKKRKEISLSLSHSLRHTAHTHDFTSLVNILQAYPTT